MTAFEGHIGAGQGIQLTAAMLSAMLFLQYPLFLVETGGPAAWLVAAVMTVGALAVFLPMSALARRFPGANLAQISEEVAGPVLGSLLTLGVASWLVFSASLTVRNFTETFIASILPTTPPSVIVFGVLTCVAYASYRGLEGLSRASQILFPLIMAGALVVLLFSLSRADGSLLYPLWGHGLVRAVIGGGYYTSMGSEVIVLLVLGHAFRSASDFRRSGIYGLLLFGLSAMLTVAVLVAVFGAQDAAQSPFPVYHLTRLVYLGRFLQRTESVIVLFWVFAAVVRVAVLFHGAVISLGSALRLPFFRPTIFPVIVIVFAVSLFPKDLMTVIRLERDWNRLLGLYMLAVPMILLVLAIVRKKGETNHAS